ncbi:MAG: hypothetical protein JNK10_03825 [Cyclobacteriaceae bacterium]|nr:hypothetical protein [Cyclobacteriaceae bacterium]
MVEVFRTNVTLTKDAGLLIDILQGTFHGSRVNFDLDDCDKILRMESPFSVSPSDIVMLLHGMGFEAETLPEEPADEVMEITS